MRLLQGRKRVEDCLEMAFVRRAGGGARLGVVVSRRFLPRAVDRNTLKRIVREAFRARSSELPDADVLIRLRQSLKGRSVADWRGDVGTAAGNLLGSIGR
jgi:ribonuclease P protein component